MFLLLLLLLAFHRDIKSSNIVITANLTAKIIDCELLLLLLLLWLLLLFLCLVIIIIVIVVTIIGGLSKYVPENPVPGFNVSVFTTTGMKVLLLLLFLLLLLLMLFLLSLYSLAPLSICVLSISDPVVWYYNCYLLSFLLLLLLLLLLVKRLLTRNVISILSELF